MTKKLVDSELLFKAEQLFDELRGEVNPERGYANELEAEILIARDQFRAALSAPQQEAVATLIEPPLDSMRDQFWVSQEDAERLAKEPKP